VQLQHHDCLAPLYLSSSTLGSLFSLDVCMHYAAMSLHYNLLAARTSYYHTFYSLMACIIPRSILQTSIRS
jgi:hypothetical protein